jgi:hypothetical protein
MFYVVLHDGEIVAQNIKSNELSSILEDMGYNQYTLHSFKTIGEAEYWVTTWEAK